nr:DNA helicase [Tanacetum cinerariifolium]
MLCMRHKSIGNGDGCKSFIHIRTVNGTTYPTNRAACKALGLINGDEEWIMAFQEADGFATASELRRLFVHILIFCNVYSPINLWKRLWQNLFDDVPSKLSKNFRLPTPPEDMLPILQNRLLMEETNYNSEVLLKEKNLLIATLDEHQKLIFDEIITAVQANVQKLIFIYGHGGIGKTFLWKAITTALRSEEKIVLTIASSGLTEAKKERINHFSTWLLDICNGHIVTPDETDTKDVFNVDIPLDLCILDSDMALTKLIDFIFDNITLQTPIVGDLQKKAIVSPTNESADMINTHVLSSVNHRQRIYLSSDEVIPHGNDGGETELLYPTEYLNSTFLASHHICCS